ncbi:MAG: hypothetical protein KF729_23980 [Sandaracinaceae bacterium]|nr:hypothetical protein [Sandaracinaceae bacterium]
MTRAALDRHDLVERHPGLSDAVAGALVEAAAVALSRHHVDGAASFRVDDGGRGEQVEICWTAPDDRARRAWNDASRATEWAAEAIAIVAVELARNLVVVGRAARGTRNDFHLGREGDGLETAALLEVAGCDDCGLPGLLAKKQEQAALNPDALPAIAAVVRFARPHVMIDDA